MDGSLPPRVSAANLGRPFMLMLSDGHVGDDSVDRFARRQRGPLVRATFARVEHLGFTDLLTIIPRLARRAPGLRNAIPVGTANPARALAAQRAYLRAFLDTYLRSRPSPLLRPGARGLHGVDLSVRG
jgi:hypothetical protein